MRAATLFSLAIFAFVLLFPELNAKFYKDYNSINSRVPGDELLWHSSHALQNLSFFATVQLDVRYPQDRPHSDYILTHILVTGQDDSGYLNTKFNDGGPGSDFVKLKILFNSIKNGDFEVFVYGKKK